MDEKTFLQRIEKVNVWRRGDQRAPHKPLLLLLALARKQRCETRLADYEKDIRGPLKGLLKSFGPQRRSYRPENPFWHLQNDDLWEIPDPDLARIRGGSGSPTDRRLRDEGARGGFPRDAERLLTRRPELISQAAQRILDGHFPPSLHETICEAVGLSREVEPKRSAERLQRDPNFRHAVLTAYERRCAICDFDMRIDDDLVALEAAHIKWHAAGGPDAVPNGLALCTLHHRTFDLGAIGLDRAPGGLRLIVSENVNGQSEPLRRLLAQHGRRIREPQRSRQRPSRDFVDWHRRQVFRGSPRDMGVSAPPDRPDPASGTHVHE